MTHSKMKREKSEVNNTKKEGDTNDKVEPEKITRSGKVWRGPKRYEYYQPFSKNGNVILMYICVGHLLDSCICLMVKLVNIFTTVYVYSLDGNNINYSNYGFL